MAVEILCYLDDTLLEDEPINLRQIVLSITRDTELHGIGHEASTSALEFITNGYAYLETVRKCAGQLATTIFRVDMRCEPGEDFVTIIEGKVNYSNYKTKCGTFCSATVPIESVTCEVLLKNKWDQAVDMDAIVTFDKLNALAAYDDLNITLILPTKDLDYKTEGSVKIDNEDTIIGPTVSATQVFVARPDYEDIVAQNIKQSELTGATLTAFFESGIISPAVLFDENITNFPDPFIVNARLKGNISWTTTTVHSRIWLILLRGLMRPDNYAFTDPTYYPDTIEFIEITTPGTEEGPQSIDFDYIFETYNWSPRSDGEDGIYAFLFTNGAPEVTYTIHFDPETFIRIETTKQVPATNVPAYLIHEVLSRAAESVTDNCCRVKSSYYGRTDSQPFAFDVDGCGGLRFLTSGLKIRNAPDGKFFVNLRDTLKDLQCIDNIGAGIEPDLTTPAGYVLRVEDLDFFYQNAEIFRCLLIPKAAGVVDAKGFYSTFNTGYKKWETEANFGLDEYNANKVYRTAITSLTNKLDKTSGLVAGEYAIELTREQNFAATNEADTKYDSENFIVCMKRLADYGYPYGGLVVEQGGLDSVSNIFSPGSTYNARISPVRNAMRWFRTVMASYPGIMGTNARMYFTEGVGNLTATGILADSATNPCTLEKVPLAENQDLLQTLFKDVAKATPLWQNETVTFDYPMTLSQYQAIKANPYGYVTFQCGSGDLERGWIMEVKYKVFSELATLTLKKLWVEGPACESTGPTPVIIPGGSSTALRLTFFDFPELGDITLETWNAILPGATPFTSVSYGDGTALLEGGIGITIPADTFNGNGQIGKVEDIGAVPCVVSIGDQAFLGCPILDTVVLPGCITVGDSAFDSSPGLTTINLAACTTLGSSTADNGVFSGISGNTITFTILTATATDDDVVDLQSINTVTLIMV